MADRPFLVEPVICTHHHALTLGATTRQEVPAPGRPLHDEWQMTNGKWANRLSAFPSLSLEQSRAVLRNLGNSSFAPSRRGVMPLLQCGATSRGVTEAF